MSQRERGIVCPIDEHICGIKDCVDNPHMPACMTRVVQEVVIARSAIRNTDEFMKVYGKESLINKAFLQVCKELGVDPELMRETLGFSLLHRTRP